MGEAIRVVMLQAALPAYRRAVFEQLASRPGLDYRLWYSTDGAVPNREAKGFQARFVPTRRLPGGFLWCGAQVAACTRREADVVVLPWNTRQLLMFAAILRARLSGVRVVLWGHGYSKNEAGWRAALRRWSGRRADAVATYNAGAAASLVAAGLPKDRVFVALNALDQGPIQAAREACLGDAAQFVAFQRDQRIGAFAPGASADRPGGVLLFVSRLTRENRVDRLIDAGVALRDRHPGLVVTIVGKGEALDELKAHAQAKGAGDTVRFLGAIYEEENLAPWFCSATAFCYPENIGLSILHAMGYGLPVVTSDKRESQNPEIEALEDGANGLAYRHGDQASLESALERLLSEPGLRERMGAQARQAALDRFTVANMVDGLEGAIRRAAAR